MDRKAFLERVNKRAMARYGVAMSDRSLSDWVVEELVPGPVRVPIVGRTGSDRIWTVRSYYRALLICRFKMQGRATFDQMRIYLWLRSNEDITCQIRTSMEHECSRIFTAIRRPLGVQNGMSDKMTETKLLHLGKKRLNKVDPRLSSFSKHLPPQLFKILSDMALFVTSPSFSTFPIIQLVGLFVPEHVKEKLSAMGIDIGELATAILPLFKGFFDLPEDSDEAPEGAGLDSLFNAEPEIFYICRRFCKVKQRFFNSIPVNLKTIFSRDLDVKEAIDAISYSIQYYPWNYAIFLLMLHASYRSRKFFKMLVEISNFLEKFENHEITEILNQRKFADA